MFFLLVNSNVPEELYDNFSKMAPLFVVEKIFDCNMPETMKIYEEKIGRRTVTVTEKVLGVTKVKKIL